MKQKLNEPSSSEIRQESVYSWWQISSIPLGLVAATVASYFSSLSYGFQFDDIANIKKMFDIRHDTFAKLFFQRPRWISQWLNTIYYSHVQFNPMLYRIGNVIIHSVGGILVFYLLYTLLSGLRKDSFFKRNSLLIAATTAGLFLLHPVQTQTVSYVIQGQLEGLAGVLTIGIVLCFVKWLQAKTTFGKYGLGALLIFICALSIGAKEITVVAPVLVLLTDWFFIAQGDVNEIKKRWLHHATVWAAILATYIYFKADFMLKAATFQLESRNNIGNQLTQDPQSKIYPVHFAISQFKVMLHYMVMFVWPFNISVEYDWMLSTSFFAADCFLPFMALATLWSCLAYALKKNSANVIAFGFAWFFVAVLPRSSIIPSSELLVDYKTYLASMGMLFVLACALVWLVQFFIAKIKSTKASMPVTYASLACILLLTGFATHERNKVWRSGLDFWGNVMQNAPGKARAYNNFAVALSDQKKYRESIPFYKKAVQMDGKYPDPWNNLAVIYSLLGDLDGAIEAMKQTIRIQPYYPEAYNNMASFLLQKKEYDEAEKMIKIALKLRKHYGKAYFNYGKLYLQQDKLEESLPYFKKACLEADMDNEAGFKIYAQVAYKLQNWPEAILALSKLCYFCPNSLEYKAQLGQAYLLDKQYDKSLTLFESLAQANPGECKYWFNAGESAYQLEAYEKGVTYLIKAQETGFKGSNLFLRLASCHDALGNKVKAREALLTAQALPDLSAALKKQVAVELAQL
ncbi:MAG: tetratricopeptide repeat protein [Candidatus Babeliales bacterium]